jgi:hypothetical protein
MNDYNDYIKGEIVKQITDGSEKFALTFHRDNNTSLGEYIKINQTIQSGIIDLSSNNEIDPNTISLDDIPV